MNEMVPALLVAKEIRFSYTPAHEVLRGIDCTLESGTLVALVGNNGAGKTTLLRLLAGLLSPSSGSLQQEATLHQRQALGALLGQPLCWRSLRVGEWLRAFSGFYPNSDPAWREELLERLSLDPAAPVRSLSSGNLQKLHLIRTLQHRPALLLLDEPTARLDPGTRRIFWQLLREITAAGAATLISSHQMEELEQGVDEALLLEGGVIAERIRLDAPDRGWRIEVECSEELFRSAIAEHASALLALRNDNGRLVADWPPTVDRCELLHRLIDAKITPLQLGAIPLFDRWKGTT